MLNGFFDPDGRFATITTKIFDVVFLSVLWIAFSIPVITIGASTTALYYTTVKGVRRNRGYIFKNFWKSFKMNFIPATLMWLLVAAVGYVLWFNYLNAEIFGSTLKYALYIINALVMGIWMLFTAYVFPVLSRFNLTKKQLMMNSLFIAIRHLPWTLLMIGIGVGTFLLVNLLFYTFPPVLLVFPAIICLIYSLPMEKVLKKVTPESEENPADDWYME